MRTVLFWVVTQQVVLILADISRQTISRTFAGQDDRLSRNVGQQLPLLAA